MKIKSIIFLVIGIVIVVGLLFILKPKKQQDANNPASQVSISSPQASPQSNNKIFELIVKNKKLVSGPEIIKVEQGDNVTINITTDEEEEFHLHGYEKIVDLEKDKPALLSFTANLTGRFIYELENSKTDIGALEVSPR